MVMSRACGLTRVSSSLAGLLEAKENSVRQRLREWYYAKEDKRGASRCEVDVSQSFMSLLRWILSWWPAPEKRLALAMDATSLGDRLVVLAISVVYRGCAIPVAWRVLRAAQPGGWKEPWLELFSAFDGLLLEDWVVIVLADRGLYAKWLWEVIQKHKWHPFLRINQRFFFRPHEADQFTALSIAFQQPGSSWSGVGTCFRVHSIQATLLVRWEQGCSEPWLILTDFPPHQASPTWYGLRTWIEGGFKCLKRAGWQWQYTRMSDPQRATRFWLALAVATLWVLSVGGEADAHLPLASLPALPETHIARRRTSRKPLPRLISCFQRGLNSILNSLVTHRPLPLGRFLPDPWPS